MRAYPLLAAVMLLTTACTKAAPAAPQQPEEAHRSLRGGALRDVPEPPPPPLVLCDETEMAFIELVKPSMLLMRSMADLDACPLEPGPDGGMQGCVYYEAVRSSLREFATAPATTVLTLLEVLEHGGPQARWVAADAFSESCWTLWPEIVDAVLWHLARERNPIVAVRLAELVADSGLDPFAPAHVEGTIDVFARSSVPEVYWVLRPSNFSFPIAQRVLRETAARSPVTEVRADAVMQLERYELPEATLCGLMGEVAVDALAPESNLRAREMLARLIVRDDRCEAQLGPLIDAAIERARVDQLMLETYRMVVRIEERSGGTAYRAKLIQLSRVARKSFKYVELRDVAAAQLERWQAEPLR